MSSRSFSRSFRPAITLLCAGFVSLWTAGQASGQSVVQQTIAAEAVVIGKVVGIETDLKVIEPNPGGSKFAYAIANVWIKESLLGGPGLTHIRVGFAGTGPVGMRRFRKPFIAQHNSGLTPGQEGCFFLRKNAAADCYVLQDGMPLDRSDINYENRSWMRSKDRQDAGKTAGNTAVD